MRKFETGATRNSDDSKNDHEGFLSPLVIECFGNYMNSHRKQLDGVLRDSDNWQKGIPLDVYMKSGWRHFLDWWAIHRGDTCRIDPQHGTRTTTEDALCALLFNAMGYLHEMIKAKGKLLIDIEKEKEAYEKSKRN